jgi:hypothetical protein
MIEDLNEFITTEDFGIAATLDGNPVTVILYREYTETVIGEIGFQSAATRALVVSANAPAAAQGQSLVAGAVTYKVIAVEVDPPDAGQGFTALRLERQ